MSCAASSVAHVAFLDWPQLTVWLAERRAVAGFLVALSTRGDSDTAIRQARGARPATPIIACAAPDPCSAGLFVRAVQAGADHVALNSADEIQHTVERVFAEAMQAPECADAAHRALPWIPALAQPMVAYCTMSARRRPTVVDVAAALGVSERSLYRLLGGLQLPTPETTIGWCRLFVAAQMIESGRSIDTVAISLGFGSGSSLRNMFKRYTDRTLATIDGPSAVAHLAREYGAAGAVTRLLAEPV